MGEGQERDKKALVSGLPKELHSRYILELLIPAVNALPLADSRPLCRAPTVPLTSGNKRNVLWAGGVLSGRNEL